MRRKAIFHKHQEKSLVTGVCMRPDDEGVAVSKKNIAEGCSDVAAGMRHGIALGSSGVVYTWGVDISGRLGGRGGGAEDANAEDNCFSGEASGGSYYDLSSQQRVAPQYINTYSSRSACTPLRAASLHRQVIVSVAAGLYASAAVSESGGLFMWGANHYGTLGLGDTFTREEPTRVPLPPDPVTSQESQAFHVAIGLGHTLVISRTCALFAWGLDSHGQTGTAYGKDCAGIDSATTTLAAVNVYESSLSREAARDSWRMRGSMKFSYRSGTMQRVPPKFRRQEAPDAAAAAANLALVAPPAVPVKLVVQPTGHYSEHVSAHVVHSGDATLGTGVSGGGGGGGASPGEDHVATSTGGQEGDRATSTSPNDDDYSTTLPRMYTRPLTAVPRVGRDACVYAGAHHSMLHDPGTQRLWTCGKSAWGRLCRVSGPPASHPHQGGGEEDALGADPVFRLACFPRVKLCAAGDDYSVVLTAGSEQVWVCDRSMMFSKRLSRPPGCWRATELEDLGQEGITGLSAGMSKTIYVTTANGGAYAWRYSAFPLAPPERLRHTEGMHIARISAGGGPRYAPLLIGWESAPSPVLLKSPKQSMSPMLTKALSLLSHIDQALELPPRDRGQPRQCKQQHRLQWVGQYAIRQHAIRQALA